MNNKYRTLDASMFKGEFIGLNPYVRKERKSVFVWKYYKKISELNPKKIERKKVKSKIS